MFAEVGAKFDDILNTYVLGVVSTLMTAIAPIALTAMTIWVALYGWAVLRNEVSETLPVFMWKVFKIGLVLAFALQSGFYISNVADSANALATGVATTFLPAATDPMTVTSPYALLDAFNDHERGGSVQDEGVARRVALAAQHLVGRGARAARSSLASFSPMACGTSAVARASRVAVTLTSSTT